MHSPLTQGAVSHSSISVREKRNFLANKIHVGGNDYTQANVAKGFETIQATAPIASVRVDALTVDARIGLTFIHV